MSINKKHEAFLNQEMSTMEIGGDLGSLRREDEVESHFGVM